MSSVAPPHPNLRLWKLSFIERRCTVFVLTAKRGQAYFWSDDKVARCYTTRYDEKSESHVKDEPVALTTFQCQSATLVKDGRHLIKLLGCDEDLEVRIGEDIYPLERGFNKMLVGNWTNLTLFVEGDAPDNCYTWGAKVEDSKEIEVIPKNTLPKSLVTEPDSCGWQLTPLGSPVAINSCPDEQVLPRPGYWPVTTLIANESTRGKLVEACGNSLNGIEWDIRGGHGSFLRDIMLPLYKGSAKNCEELELVKDFNAGQNGAAKGGNFLFTYIGNKLYLFCGYSASNEGHSPDGVLRCLATKFSAQLVMIDVGWLGVGHIDEIISFPNEEHVLIASPKVFFRLMGKEMDAVNAAVQKKMDALERKLTALPLNVVLLPVQYELSTWGEKKGKVVSTGGNPVNCIYINDISVHSHINSTVDEEVKKIMEAINYSAKFCSTDSENAQSGAGGNVHCITNTLHAAKK
jgi:hypothetical protein